MLNELKNYLDITWNDPATDEKLQGILNRATAVLNNYAGSEIDFSANENEKQLLFDCCRYIYNNVFEEFKINFSAELITLRAKYKIIAEENKNDEV